MNILALVILCVAFYFVVREGKKLILVIIQRRKAKKQQVNDKSNLKGDKVDNARN